jgi:hypothetical protein
MEEAIGAPNEERLFPKELKPGEELLDAGVMGVLGREDGESKSEGVMRLGVATLLECHEA